MFRITLSRFFNSILQSNSKAVRKTAVKSTFTALGVRWAGGAARSVV
jgi:hypothetical protein